MTSERIAVVAGFANGSLKPILFRRGRNDYRVEEITYRWQSRSGREKIYHFSAISGAGLYHLSFHSEDMNWLLEEVQDL